MTSTFINRMVFFVLFITLGFSVRAQAYLYEIGGISGGVAATGVLFRYRAEYRWAFRGNVLWGGCLNKDLILAGGQVEFNFLPYGNKSAYLYTSKISPYLLLGAGMVLKPGNRKVFTDFYIPLGAGVKYKLADRINISGEFSYPCNPFRVKNEEVGFIKHYPYLLFSISWEIASRNWICNNKNSNSNYK